MVAATIKRTPLHAIHARLGAKLVANAANIAKDWEHVVAHKRGANVRLKDVSDETGLLAVQGPGAEALIAPLTPLGVAMIPYYHFAPGKVAGVECFLSRTGYTGEDGFELYCRGADLERLCTRSWHPVAASRAAWAPATRCGSRRATRCTATTSTTRSPPSRRASAGSWNSRRG